MPDIILNDGDDDDYYVDDDDDDRIAHIMCKENK